MRSSLNFKKKNMSIVSCTFSQAQPIYVRDFGWHKTAPSHVYGPAIRTYFLLHLIVDGKGVVERDGHATPLGAGEAFLIRPEEVVTYRADKDEPWEYYWISFYGDFAETLMSQTTDKLYMPYKQSGLIALQSALKNKFTTTVDALNALFAVLSSIQNANNAKTTESDAIAVALHYLENNYFEEIDVAALAARLGFSRAYFSTLFTKRTGEAPYRFLTKIRMEKAKEYLSTSAHSVEEIAYSVGFSCIGRFCSLFKKYTGVSPLQYRKTRYS